MKSISVLFGNLSNEIYLRLILEKTQTIMIVTVKQFELLHDICPEYTIRFYISPPKTSLV